MKKYNETIDFDNIDDEEEINIPDRFKGNEHFYEFLLKHGAVEKYLTAFDKYEANKYDLKRFLSTNPYDSYIMNAFGWSNESDLWNRLHDLWYYEVTPEEDWYNDDDDNDDEEW